MLSRRDVLKAGALSAVSLSVMGETIRQVGAETDVIVIGAGLSGLNATLLLEELGASVRVLEGSNRIGGRVFTALENEVPGHPELGASGMGHGYARLIDNAAKYGVALGPLRPRTEAPLDQVVMHLNGEPITLEAWQSHRANPFTDDAFRKMLPRSAAYRTYAAQNPLPSTDLDAWRDPKFAASDISLHQFLSNQGWTDRQIKLGAGTNMGYGSSEFDVSAMMMFQNLRWLQYQDVIGKGRGGMAGVGGNQRIPEAMHAAVRGDVIQNAQVVGIQSDKDGAVVTTNDGRSHRARFVICTMPFSALRLVPIDPLLPAIQAEAVAELGYTPSVQIHFVPKKRYWEEDGLPPSIWSDRICGRFMALRNNPEQPEEVTSMVAYTNGHAAMTLDRYSEQAAIRLVTRELESMRPSLKGALQFVKYWSWTRSPFAGGTYAYWKPGQITRYAESIATPHQRMHFAGEHTAVLERGMEGAMESGERAAFEVASRL